MLAAKTERKGQIVGIIKDMHEVTIKDIASRIVRCSEKTLQRDLQELLQEGKIKKTGDRRWSKYTAV
jgi:DeoR/GlpR family transcriptional regulator of sugar metabolism